MPPRPSHLTGPAPTYQPFGTPPEQPVYTSPIKDGIFGYSSTGMTIGGYRPKRPSDLLATITAQYEEPERTRFGQEVRGGRGKKKDKGFFRAHLSWYGMEYSQDDTRDELEDMLNAAMSTRPPPVLPPAIYEMESILRQRWLDAAAAKRVRVVDILVQQGHTVHTSEALAELTGANSLTDEFFDHQLMFFRNHFAYGVPPDHVVVLTNYDTIAEHEIYEWACDRFNLLVQKVDNTRGRGRDRGRFADFVIGRNMRAVQAKADQIRRQRGVVNARFTPY